MKRYMLFLAGLMILAPYGEADAKAVKLGRGRSYSVAIDTSVNTGANGTQVRKGECESNDECAADKKCMNYKCVDVCTQPTQSGMSMGRICAGQKCITDPDTPHAFKCVDACYNVQCLPGNTTEVTSSGCCCVALPCNIPSNVASCSACSYSDTLGENICTSATCETGYGWWAVSSQAPTCNKCTVPAHATSCSACQYDATYGQKCTQATCETGYTWKTGTNGYSCQPITCSTGYAFRTKRDGEWDAGCYPIGDCDTVRSDLDGATCMFVNPTTGLGQCKTDTVYSSSECIASCPVPSNATSCSACSYSDTAGTVKCTTATCKSGYGWWATNSNGPTCNKCTVPSNASSCTACQYDATYGQKCTSAVCNSGYTWKAGIGGYSCQKTTTAQANTGTCTVSSSRCCVNSLGTTVCPSGYTASGGTCVKGDEKMYCIAYATK